MPEFPPGHVLRITDQDQGWDIAIPEVPYGLLVRTVAQSMAQQRGQHRWDDLSPEVQYGLYRDAQAAIEAIIGACSYTLGSGDDKPVVRDANASHEEES